MKWSTVTCYQPISQLLVDRVVLNSIHSHNYELTNESSLRFHRTCLQIYRLLIRCLEIDCLQIDRLQLKYLQINLLQVLLQPWSITQSKPISEFTRSQPPSASSNLPEHGLQAHLWVHSIYVSKVITKITWSWHPSASLSLLILSFLVHLHNRSIMASKFIFKAQWQVYASTGISEVDRVTRSIYLADPGVDKYLLISSLYYHTMKIHNRCFPTFGLTCPVQDFLYPCNCLDPDRKVVSFRLACLLCASNLICTVGSIPFRCHEMCSGVMIVASQPSSFIV